MISRHFDYDFLIRNHIITMHTRMNTSNFILQFIVKHYKVKLDIKHLELSTGSVILLTVSKRERSN